MEYVADTIAITRFISHPNRLGKRALVILREADSGNSKIILSIISLVEIMYLSEKGRLKFKLKDVLEKVDTHEYFQIIDLDRSILLEAQNIQNLELHDRLIVATAKHLELPLLTCDQDIKSANLIETIWD